MRYIWSARLELCRRELARTSRDEKLITNIAFSYGFNSAAHFSRTFKQKFGGVAVEDPPLIAPGAGLRP